MKSNPDVAMPDLNLSVISTDFIADAQWTVIQGDLLTSQIFSCRVILVIMHNYAKNTQHQKFHVQLITHY